MGIRSEKIAKITVTGSFDAGEFVSKMMEICDGDPSNYTCNVTAMPGDQRESAFATFSFTEKRTATKPYLIASSPADFKGPNA